MASHRPSGAVESKPNMQDTDANSLFEKHTIEEIRDLEKKTRSDIEKKKEDLRVMVGERYRDLIDAADTIADMKTSAENVMKSISSMENLCNTMRQKHMVKGASFHMHINIDRDKNTREQDFYGTAAQIKLLMDIPEKIWSSVESQEYLEATQLYLLARHINTSLHLDPRRSSDVITWFPVLTRQWAAISHFKTTILQGCRSLLTDTEADLSDLQMANVLCSIILLEDSTPRQVFTEFLLARTKALQQILHSGQQGNVKLQVTGVARLLTSSLRQIYSVFYYHDSQSSGHTPGEPFGLLLTTLDSVVSKSNQDTLLWDMQGTISSRCLPQSVRNFKPMLRTPATALQAQHLKDNCQQWINTCLQDVQSGVGKLLNYVNTVKRLADIRDEVWELLSTVESTVSWKQISESIVCLKVWEDFFRPLFVGRVKALVQFQLDTAAELTNRTISKVMMELTSDMNDSSLQCERDLSVFLWTENPSDIIMADIWQAASTKTLSDCGGLVLKARAFTPAVQNLCHSVDEKLKVLLEDTETYVLGGNNEDVKEQGAFNRFADTADILKYMQGSCVKCVQEILDYLTEQLRLWEKSLADIPDPLTNAITENKVLLTGRMCSAMSEITPHLQRCILALPDWDKQASFNLTKKRTQKPSDLPEWQAVHSKLVQCQMLAYRIWINYTAKKLMTATTDYISSTSPDVILSTATRWDEVEILEETEEGKKLSSKIYVPMQASWQIQTLLHRLCADLNKIGVQALPRSVITDLLVVVTDDLLTSYEQLLSSRGKKNGPHPLSQHEVLQEMFNFKFIQLIIPRKGDEEIHKKYEHRCQAVVAGLEELVDPFDLDVFSPYMQANLLKQAQRCSVIFGALASLDKHGGVLGSTTSRPVLSSQEQHNILPLSSCPQRFPLLPLSSKQASRSALTTQPMTAQAINRAPEVGGQSLTSAVEATLPMTSSQADLSSSFYDKMEKLGSMGSRIFSNISGKS
ncbi:conserved oligomeric Golgi complex subunit 1 isoform X1 [Aplysia californica]|uniref:Conserved oligomeric Golgi complex subunit 1 n=2 Tax=Aplysia californica TaxID=6500 RepID=A0ABM0ZU84_APLCA|nr:conserved oligomeric Golgi complex subunit 1 isoform X1 [Aplysia californica]